MSRTIANGVEITKQCWQALLSNPQLMIFPLLSGISLLLVGVVFLVPTLGIVGVDGDITDLDTLSTAQWVLLLTLSFLYYFACYFVIIFCNTALVGVSLKLLRGQTATVGDGLQIAMSRLGQIIGFALISATVGTIARAISNAGRSSDNLFLSLFTALLGGLIQGVWSVVVFFAIPVYVVENLGPVAAIKRSWAIFKKTWGEGFTGRAVIGGVGCLVQFVLTVVFVGLFVIALGTGSIIALGLTALLALVTFGAIVLLTGAINGIFQAALYHYATTGQSSRFLDANLARNAFAASA